MHKYRLTPSAKSDLIEIWNYTVETWGEKQAEKYLHDIEDKLNQLAANPGLGRQRPEIVPGYYSFPAREHIVFYLISDRHIDIIGILHGKMDIDKNLMQFSP
jgi:toxin ParE1/3/4